MSTSDPPAGYAAFTQALIDDLRTHGEVTQGPFAGRQVLLLSTRGARTGESRVAPLAYTRDGERYVIVASKSGAPTNPAWYHTLQVHPEATVETGRETFQVRAREVTGPERDRLYDAHAAVHPVFKDYPQRTSRVIPVLLLERID